MIIACHRLGKTTEMIVKFANRKDAELVLKSKKKKAKRYKLARSLYSTDGNCRLLSHEADSNSENVNVSDKNQGGKVYIYIYIYIYIKVFAPIIGSFTFRLWNDIMKDSFTTSG